MLVTRCQARAKQAGRSLYDKIAERRKEATQLNDECKELSVHFFSVDLEWAICDG